MDVNVSPGQNVMVFDYVQSALMNVNVIERDRKSALALDTEEKEVKKMYKYICNFPAKITNSPPPSVKCSFYSIPNNEMN